MIFLGSPRFELPLCPPSCFLFSNSDTREAVWATNSSKATDNKGFQVEFFTDDLRALASHLANLFNHVVYIGFPSAWPHHIIHPIHKSGSNSNPNNYRMIMVGHTFSKLYATVLHMQLSSELEHRHLRARGQA
jgi:hypothetical protein